MGSMLFCYADFNSKPNGKNMLLSMKKPNENK